MKIITSLDTFDKLHKRVGTKAKKITMNRQTLEDLLVDHSRCVRRLLDLGETVDGHGAAVFPIPQNRPKIRREEL